MRTLLIVCFCLFAFNASADWQLNPNESSLTFNTTKNATKTETHSFTDFTGSVSNTGHATLLINTASVNTNISIRDQRLKKLFFKTTEFAHAKVTLDIPSDLMGTQQPGTHKTLSTKAQITLVGTHHDQATTLNIEYINATKVRVSSKQPVLINVNQYHLLEGLNQLKEIAGLQSIDHSIPVNFSLTFQK